MRRDLAVVTLLGTAAYAAANPLTWDSSGTNPASPVDGFGVWDTSTPRWSDGTQDVAWNNANADTPVFGSGGTAGSVTVDGLDGVTATGLIFRPVAGSTPYTLNGRPINLAPGDNLISAPNSGATPIIRSTLAGSGQTRNVTFAGSVTLAAGANSYAGSSTVTQTNILIGDYNVQQAYTAPFGAAGNALTLNDATLTGNGSTTGYVISYELPYNINIIGTDTILTGKNFNLGSLSSTLYTVRGDGSLTFNSNVSDAISSISASFSGTGPDAFTGTLHVDGYNTRIYSASVGNFLGVPNGTLDLNGTLSPYPTGSPVTVSFGALTGSGELGDFPPAVTHVTWSVGSLGLSTTYSGNIIGNSAFTLTGGTLTLANPSSKPNAYTGPTTVAGGTLVLAGSNLTSTSSISVANAATLRLQAGSTINTATLSLASGATLDITSNPETFDTTVPGHDAASLIAAIASAYDNGAWDGVGITSSTAAPVPTGNPVLAIGYRVTGSQFFLQLAYIGDANLDRKVDADDYALLDRSYARSATNALWADGDFNYDGVIDASDYHLIDRVYYLTHGFDPEFLTQRESQFGETYVSTLLASLPEPSLVAWLAAASPLLRRRRRRALG